MLRHIDAARLQFREEAVNLVPNIGSTGEAPPVHADQSHQMKALVDGNDVILRRHTHAIDQKRLNIGLDCLQCRMSVGYLCPRTQG